MTHRTAVLYARVSTKGQAEEGYSLRQQMEALRRWAEAEGYEVLEEVEDAGHSGASLERPGLDRVRDLVTSSAVGGISVVLAQDRDRFSREPAYTWLLRREFEEHGTHLRALSDRGDESPEGELTDGILDQLAKYERAKIAERSRRGKLRKAREGKVLRGPHPPYGFAYTEDGDGLIVDPERMAVVCDVFRMIGAEGLTMGETQRRLNRRGIPSPMATDARRWRGKSSGRWSVSTVRMIVWNPLYRPLTAAEVASSGLVSEALARSLDPANLYGLWGWNRGGEAREPGKDGRSAFAPIPLGDGGAPLGPPRAIVDAARERIGRGERRPPSTAAHRFWQLSGGIVYCGECGSVLSPKARRRPSGKIDAWYMCRQRHNNGARDCTHSRSYRAAELEETIWQEVLDLVSNPERVMRQHERYVERKRAEMRDDPNRKVRGLTEKLRKLERRRSGYLDLAADGDMTREELRAKLGGVEEKRGEIEQALRLARESQQRIVHLDLKARTTVQLIEHFAYITYLVATPGDRRRLYLALQLRATVEKDGTIRLSGIFDPDVYLLDVMQDGPADLTQPVPEQLKGARVVPTSYTPSPPQR